MMILGGVYLLFCVVADLDYGQSLPFLEDWFFTFGEGNFLYWCSVYLVYDRTCCSFQFIELVCRVLVLWVGCMVGCWWSVPATQ